MAYINLIDKLSDRDKELIKQYIFKYGVAEKYFMGLEDYLQAWSHANQKLYKLLGNSLIKEFDFTFTQDNRDYINRVRGELFSLPFKSNYHDFYHSVILPLYQKEEIDKDTKRFFNCLLNEENFVVDKITYGVKYKAPDAKKTLQLQPGTKIMKAISKVVNYFDFLNNDYFEEFRIKHAIITTEKVIKGKLCVSIHPLDYMTMSDNTLGWTSCMSWYHNGCYHVGTVEMMNSNNVLCCYTRGNDPFYFATDEETGEVYSWNNKRWRQLVYVNKNIIMSGKAYPYSQNDVSKLLLNHIKEMAEENLNWHYQFGIEKYRDMIHINSLNKMNQNRAWMRAKSKIKSNIIWDTNGMYNDMFNDPDTTYWCYRNKVDGTKIYNASGKCPCLICGEQVIEADDWNEGYYNDRYSNTGSVVCKSCLDGFKCDFCEATTVTEKDDPINVEIIRRDGFLGKMHLCNNCYKYRVKICPDCGRPFMIGDNCGIGIYNEYRDYKADNFYMGTKNNPFIDDDPFSTISVYDYFRDDQTRVNRRYNEEHWFDRLYCCNECGEKFKEGVDYSVRHTKMRWSTWLHKEFVFTNDPKYQKYRYVNLKSPSEIPTEPILPSADKDFR